MRKGPLSAHAARPSTSSLCVWKEKGPKRCSRHTVATHSIYVSSDRLRQLRRLDHKRGVGRQIRLNQEEPPPFFLKQIKNAPSVDARRCSCCHIVPVSRGSTQRGATHPPTRLRLLTSYKAHKSNTAATHISSFASPQHQQFGLHLISMAANPPKAYTPYTVGQRVDGGDVSNRPRATPSLIASHKHTPRGRIHTHSETTSALKFSATKRSSTVRRLRRKKHVTVLFMCQSSMNHIRNKLAIRRTSVLGSPPSSSLSSSPPPHPPPS